MNKKLLLIDTFGLIFRAYYAYPSYLKTSNGQPTNAIFGFLQMLIYSIEKFEPEFIACAIESDTKTFRQILYPEYKQNRKETELDLKEQIGIIINLINKLNIHIFKKDGYEADDVIGTISHKNFNNFSKIEIITGDKDLLQLINENITIFMPAKNFSDLIEYNRQTFETKFNIKVEQYPFYKALTGDASDNIRGIPGIGPKTAAELVNKFDNINALKANLDLINPRIAESILENQNLLDKYYELSKIKCDLDIDFNINDLAIKNLNINTLRKTITEYEFFSLQKKISKFIDNFQKKYQPIEIFFNKWEEYEIQYSLVDDLKFNETDKTLYIFNNSNKFLIGNGKEFKEINNTEEIYKLWVIFKPEKLIGFNLKEIIKILIKFDLKQLYKINWIDLKLAWYLINNELVLENINDLSKHLRTTSIKEIYKKTLQEIKKLKIRKLWNIEKKIQIILAYMEIEGIPCKKEYLEEKEIEYVNIIEKTKNEMYNIIGHEFNPNSPKELGHILFEVLKLPVIKKTKTGYSTDEETLSKLENHHKIIEFIKKYRTYSKILSTYIQGFKKAIDKDGKIHTTFLQDSVSTGRLSSINPNLQNIPSVEPFYTDIRQAFQVEKGVFLSFDYSQIDLRVLAHETKDTNLINAFQNKIDIHTNTAQLILNKQNITPEERKFAKAINFGIIYGMEAYGLSKALNISLQEATDFIDNYFKKFPGVKDYFNYIEKQLDKYGFVKTLLGRRRYFNNWNSHSKQIKKTIFREAINMPIQGGSSDIIKLSMVKINKYIRKNNLNLKMILQIHDELIFFSDETNLENIIQDIKQIMENVYKLMVPLEVNYKIGKNLTFK